MLEPKTKTIAARGNTDESVVHLTIIRDLLYLEVDMVPTRLHWQRWQIWPKSFAWQHQLLHPCQPDIHWFQVLGCCRHLLVSVDRHLGRPWWCVSRYQGHGSPRLPGDSLFGCKSYQNYLAILLDIFLWIFWCTKWYTWGSVMGKKWRSGAKKSFESQVWSLL